MPPIPLLRPRDVVQTFEKFGWEVARRKGSHIILTNMDILQHYQYQTIHWWHEEHFVV
jgi:predicted RNA binding protein YcfA (HicA-like mRNA interferase family)